MAAYMGRTAGHRSETDLEFIIDSTSCGVCEKDGEGAWLITLYFSIKNRSNARIRITNLNGKIEYDTRDSHPALTLGSREVIDLRTKDPLLREGIYCDLAPDEEQPITGLFEVINWFRAPSNRVDATYALLISLSADYRVIETDQTLSATLPAFYCFQSIEPDAPSGRSSAGLACITEQNLGELFKLNKDNKEILEILGEAHKKLQPDAPSGRSSAGLAGITEQNLGELFETQHNLEESFELNKDNARILEILGEAHKKLRKKTRAKLIWAGSGPTHRLSRYWKRLVSGPLTQQIIAGLVVLAIAAVVGYLINLV